MDDITANQARDALAAAESARRRIADEVGLPRAYWWGMAAGWVGLGAVGQFGPPVWTLAATVLFGAGHAFFASRLLSGRNRTDRVQVGESVAGRRVPVIVIAMLLALVALTVLVTVVLGADGARHAKLLGAVVVGVVIGFGGPEILSVARQMGRA